MAKSKGKGIQSLPPALRANALRMKQGKPLVAKSGRKVTPKNVSKRGK